MKTLIRLLAAASFAVSGLAIASGGGAKLDRAPVDTHNLPSLQRGAQVFVNYCLNCHGAAYMRYNRMTDLGLSEAQIRDNLMFAAEKVGEPMTVAMRTKDAKEWFGAPPPDLTVIARSRGADWLYTYLRSFYRDETRTIGWNNTLFPSVAMPHVLWQLQGTQVLRDAKKRDNEGEFTVKEFAIAAPGQLTSKEYDVLVGDLVNYLVYMGEPARNNRTMIGLFVLLFLCLVLIPLAWLLKREYWKDVH